MESFRQSPITTENETEKKPLKESVDFVFEQHTELASIGTKDQYVQYIATIFPDSKFKEVVYHNSDAEFKNEGFKPMKPNFDTLNSIEGVYNFSSNRTFAQRYGINTYAVVLDIHNAIEDTSSGEYVDDIDRPLSEALFKIGKQTKANPFAPEYDENLKNTDAVINHISGEDYIEKHPRTGREWGVPPQTVVSVFHENQIHILGSSSDVQKFREFVEREK
ncbi:hypothetical protein H6790_00885 [Candidatus Nomurabacteria bacterium]|nr:hypothetical protein [Candidatus Nomurabacteria bacterium]MCB9820486.1 hypothetical protein [Candidatus Nomurabacteria bacterium]